MLVIALVLAALTAGQAGAATACTASGPYSSTVSKTSGLVAYWRLGDTSGATACEFRGLSPGTYSAGATLNQAGALAGDSDTSAAFNGSTGNVSVPASTTLNTGDTFTIEAWVKRGSTGGTQTIASKQGTAWALVFTTQNLPSLQANGKAITTSKTAVSDTTSWHHIVATKAGTAVHLYLDGTDVTGTVSNSTVANSTSALTIGSAGSTNWFNGALDELAYYSVALSADQVTNHYLLGRTTCPANTPYSQGIAQTSGLIGYWRLGERSGTAACDTTGANPGTYTGGFTLAQAGAISGDSDTSALFNGTTGWVSVPPLASLNTGDTFSVEGWLKRGTTGGTANQVIASKQGTAWTLAFNTANKLVLQSNGTTIATSTSTVADTTAWHYVAATKSGSAVHLYVDGADVTGAGTNVTLANTTSPLAIGQSGSAGWFNGRLDEIALYNVALTGGQTSNHYALGQAPANTSPPTIGGTAADGQTLTASNGSWSGATPSYAYQWRKCDSAGAGCQDVAGATGQTYAIGHGDVGATLRVVVTATNAGGSASATSAQTGAVAATAPANTALPAISGTAANGQTLTADPGTWSGTPGSFSYQWKRCDSAGATCADITSATSRTYAVATADVGSTIRVVVTDTNSAGASTATSQQTGVVVDVAPTVTANPSVTGGSTPPQEGEVLTAAQGGFSGNVTSRAFQWQSCDAQGASCADIAGATAGTYTLGHGDIASTIRVADVASNSAGSTRAYSSSRGPIASGAPQNVTLPGISGTAAENSRLTTDGGTWSGNVTSTSYQWLSCDSNGDNCVNPQTNQTSGTTSSFYDVWNWETGHRLRIRVTKTNSFGSTQATSAPTAVVTGLTPVPANPSRVTSFNGGFPPTEGQTLTAISGGWNGTVNSQHWQWQSCDSSGSNCADVQGATSNQYTIRPGEAGTEIRATEIASNAAGSARAYSVPVGPVISAKPANTVAPFINGTPTEGNRLLVNQGQWTGSWDTTSYQWKRCDSVGDNCVDITGATSTNYVVANADHGHVIRTLVTQSGAYGSTSALSAGTGAATGYPPTSSVPPTTTGGSNPPLQGDTLNAVSGSWSGVVDSRSFQWQSCDPQGANCADIAGATGSSYTLGAGDNGTKVRVAEIATNTAGTTRGYSTARGPVVSQQPTNTAPPTVVGTPNEGSLLTASDGAWSGNVTSTAYQWQRCDADGTSCVDIASGGTSSSYRVDYADHDHTLRVKVTKTGAYGSGTATSAPSATAVAAAPTAATTPQINAPSTTGAEGEVLTATGAAWNGVVITRSFQWQRCVPSDRGPNCADIDGATGDTYTLGPADAATSIVVVDIASNAAGSERAYSRPFLVSSDVPAAADPPLLRGSAVTGFKMSVSTGDWTPDPWSYSYQWQRCDFNGDNCSNLSGATEWTYYPTEDDVGATLRATVTAANNAGHGTATTSPSLLVRSGKPVNDVAPAVDGQAADGNALGAFPGRWTGAVEAYTYQWQRCDDDPSTCVDIAGATAPHYSSEGYVDVGSRLRVVVTAAGRAGSARVASSMSPIVTTRSGRVPAGVLKPQNHEFTDSEVRQILASQFRQSPYSVPAALSDDYNQAQPARYKASSTSGTELRSYVEAPDDYDETVMPSDERPAAVDGSQALLGISLFDRPKIALGLKVLTVLAVGDAAYEGTTILNNKVFHVGFGPHVDQSGGSVGCRTASSPPEVHLEPAGWDIPESSPAELPPLIKMPYVGWVWTCQGGYGFGDFRATDYCFAPYNPPGGWDDLENFITEGACFEGYDPLMNEIDTPIYSHAFTKSLSSTITQFPTDGDTLPPGTNRMWPDSGWPLGHAADWNPTADELALLIAQLKQALASDPSLAPLADLYANYYDLPDSPANRVAVANISEALRAQNPAAQLSPEDSKVIARQCLNDVKAAIKAGATGMSVNDCEQLPLFVSGSDVPAATNHDIDALNPAEGGYPGWVQLHYVPREVKQEQSPPTWKDSIPPCSDDYDGSVYNCDEYPFYATQEGGNVLPRPHLKLIDAGDNQTQGRLWGGGSFPNQPPTSFIGICNPDRTPGFAFLSVPVPPSLGIPTQTRLCNR